jgi:beta-lactamase regulating signal transducer with metallopeptidase domain
MGDFLAALLECSVSMSVPALLLMALTPLLSKRYSAKWLYYAWLVIVAGLILPFRPCFTVPVFRMSPVYTAVQRIIPVNAGRIADAADRTGAVNQGAAAVPWVQIIGVLWLAGAAVFFIYHGLRHARFRRLVRRWGKPADDPQMLRALERIKGDINITKPVKLLIAPCVSSPMMTGFLNPVILLPRSDFSPDELPYIFRHELVHFKRKDLWYKSMVILAAGVHWFNPVVYLMAKAIALQCEISCDAEVVGGTGLEARQRYSETILGVIKQKPKAQTAFSTNFYSGRTGVKKRIFSIMDTKKKKAGILILCLLVIGVLGTGTVLTAGRNAGSGLKTSKIGTSASVQNIAGKWAEAVKKRDGKAQYHLMSRQCQSAVYDEYRSYGWQTGQSSPWVESYRISVDGNRAAVIYQYATSTGPAGTYKQTLSFVKQDGRLLIDSFSSPKEIPAQDA